MICPLILKQTKKNDKGLEEWEHQPCLEDACSLFYGKKKKCSLSYNSEISQETRNILERADFFSSFQVLKSALENLQKEMTEDVKARQVDLETQQQAIREEIGGLSSEVTGKFKDQFLVKMQEIQDGLVSFSERTTQSMETIEARVGDMEQKVSGHMQEWGNNVDEMRSSLQTQLDRIGEDLQQVRNHGAENLEKMERGQKDEQERLERLEQGMREGTERVVELNGKMETQHTERVEKMETQHKESIAQVETLMGETHRMLSDLQDGNGEIHSYYTEQKQFVEEGLRKQKKDQSREQNNRGVVYYQRGAHEAAALALEKAVELDHEHAEAYNNLGLVYTALDRSEHAVQAFEKALALRPDLAEAYNNLGVLCYSGLDYEKATDMFSKALEDGCKDRSMAYTNFGNSLYQLKRFEEAAGAWKAALQINPLNQNAKKGLALLEHQEMGVL